MEEDMLIRDSERTHPVGKSNRVRDGALEKRDLRIRVLIDTDDERPRLGRDLHDCKNFPITSNVSR